MKIFISFLQSKKAHSIPAYSFWEYYIKNGLAEAGHTWQECTDVDWALGLVPKNKQEQSLWLAEAWGKTVDHLKTSPADLFLCYLYPSQISIPAISEIKKMGIPVVNFFCDNIRLFKKIPVEFSVFDLNWVPEHKALKLYQKAGYPFINLPMPMWVSPEFRKLKPELNKQISFIGSKDIQRQLFFEEVVNLRADIPLDIYGSGWLDSPAQPTIATPGLVEKSKYQYHFLKENGLNSYRHKLLQRKALKPLSNTIRNNIRGNLDFADYVTITSTSMITVGINRYPSFHFPLNKPDTYSRLRDIEAPMLGACYLTEYTEGLEELYDIGKEIEVFKDAQEFIEKVELLTADNSKRIELKTNGQKKALHEHSITQSINKIIARLGL